MAYAIQRKYPRVPFSQPAVIEYLDRREKKRVQLEGAIHTIACEGMGITIGEDLSALERRMRVTVTFPLDEGDLSLPGAVAWLKPNELGVHLLLELALPPTRQRWAHWIVEQTKTFRRRRRTTSRP